MRQLLKVRDVADVTGVGYNTVIEWVKAGLPTIRPVGRRSHLIDPSDLDAFLREHKSSSRRESRFFAQKWCNWHQNVPNPSKILPMSLPIHVDAY